MVRFRILFVIVFLEKDGLSRALKFLRGVMIIDYILGKSVQAYLSFNQLRASKRLKISTHINYY